MNVYSLVFEPFLCILALLFTWRMRWSRDPRLKSLFYSFTVYSCRAGVAFRVAKLAHAQLLEDPQTPAHYINISQFIVLVTNIGQTLSKLFETVNRFYFVVFPHSYRFLWRANWSHIYPRMQYALAIYVFFDWLSVAPVFDTTKEYRVDYEFMKKTQKAVCVFDIIFCFVGGPTLFISALIYFVYEIGKHKYTYTFRRLLIYSNAVTILHMIKCLQEMLYSRSFFLGDDRGTYIADAFEPFAAFLTTFVPIPLLLLSSPCAFTAMLKRTPPETNGETPSGSKSTSSGYYYNPNGIIEDDREHKQILKDEIKRNRPAGTY